MIYIRADAHPDVGMGHIMRCLSIADACHLAMDIIFILAENRVADFVESRGYKTFVLNTAYDRLEEELNRWPDDPPQCIIVDSYYVTPAYLTALRERLGDSGKLIYLDDLALFPYPVDILVNYNVYGLYLDYTGLYDHRAVPHLLLGPSYAPLREMFRGLPGREQKKECTDILISTGGADMIHLALKIVKLRPTGFNYHILIGRLNKDRDEIKKLAQSQPNIIIHESVGDMRALILSMDICVSAAGSTLYEICACGVPLITYILADNQIPGAGTFEKSGLAVNCGDLRTGDMDSAEKILTAVERLAGQYEYRVEVGKRMQEMIDGYGAERLVRQLMADER